MADGRANNGKKKPNKNLFKKGENHNPNGSSERARKLNHIKRLTIDELSEIGTMLLFYTRDQLSNIREDADTNMLQFWIMSLVQQSIKSGNVATFDTLMTRLIGKPPETPVTRALLDLERMQENDSNF